MSFWAYMLHCHGGYFYVGHTDDLDRRIGEHRNGTFPGFTAEHLPVELVWSEEFSTREDAKAAERKLHGWSRAKKLALIRGDWARISALARSKTSASTSSAWTGAGGMVGLAPVRSGLVDGKYFALRPHSNTPPSAVRGVAARIWMSDPNELLIAFTVEGSELLSVPTWSTPARRDGLWRATCFEMFLKCPDGRYFEFNFSPSTEWAIYAFESYRTSMKPLAVDVEPHIEFTTSPTAFSLEVDVDLGQIPPGPLRLGLSAVIEETDGTKSYWALAHPPGKPDFHAEACFAATLAATDPA